MESSIKLSKELSDLYLEISDELSKLCQEYGYEGKTGVVMFKSPFYKLLCKKLGIKWGELSRVGKAMLRANAIDTYCYNYDINSKRFNTESCFQDGSHYMKY